MNRQPTTNRTISLNGQEHASLQEALIELNFADDLAIALGGRYFTITNAEYERLQAMGIEPTTFRYSASTDQMLSVPGRHG